MFIFKYINDVLFFMNNLTRESEIYQVLINSNNIITNNTYYLIYQYNNVIYDVFVGTNTINSHSPINFYIDINDTSKHQTIILAGGTMPSNDDNYKVINLIYKSSNKYTDGINDYKILNKTDTNIDKLIRHYKVIKKRDNNVESNTYYSLYYSSDNSLCRIFDSYEAANDYKIRLQYEYKEDTYLVIENYNKHQLEQDASAYTDTSNDNIYNNDIYNDGGYTLKNTYKDDIIFFDKYNSTTDLKSKLINEYNNSTIKYRNELVINDSIDDNFTNKVNRLIEDFNNGVKEYLYIRFAPAPTEDQKNNQIKRVFQIRNVYTLYENDNYLNALVIGSEIPIYNDNLIYLSKKCNYVANKNLDTDNYITIKTI